MDEIQSIDIAPSNVRVAKRDGWTKEEINLIRDVVCNGDLTNQELALFLATARDLNLNPMTKQIYAVKRKDYKRGSVMSIQTGIDGFRAIARADGLAGISDATYSGEVEIEYKEWKTAPTIKRKVPAMATVTVKRWGPGGVEEYTASARWQSYYPGDRGGSMWHKFPELMLGKCAEALALRKGFSQLSGLYTTEEMAQEQRQPPAGIDAPQTGGRVSQLPVRNLGPEPGSEVWARTRQATWDAWSSYAEMFDIEPSSALTKMSELSDVGFGHDDLGGRPTVEQMISATAAMIRAIDAAEAERAAGDAEEGASE